MSSALQQAMQRRSAQAVAPSPPAAAPPGPSRMTLSGLTRGRQRKPVRLGLYAPPGIGKSTFGAGAPSPIFLPVEDGSAHLDVARFPKPDTWEEIGDAVRTLTTEPHDFKTFVIDTLDAAEPLAWAKVCAEARVSSIEDVGGGYGKGYTAAVDLWIKFLRLLEELQQKRGMNVILLAHSLVKAFRNPGGDDYEHYILRLNEKVAGKITEWCDDVGFANLDIATAKDPRTKRVRGIASGARYVHFAPTAAWFAKERSGLPSRLALSWADFAAAFELGQAADPTTLIAAIRANGERLPADLQEKLGEYLKVAGTDATALVQLNNWVNAQVGELEPAEGSAGE